MDCHECNGAESTAPNLKGLVGRLGEEMHDGGRGLSWAWLAAAGHAGVVLDSLVYGHREFVRWGPLIEGDIRNLSLLL